MSARPTRFRPDVIETLLECIGRGLALYEACAVADVDRVTVGRWRRKGEAERERRQAGHPEGYPADRSLDAFVDFAERIERAENRRNDVPTRVLADAMRGGERRRRTTSTRRCETCGDEEVTTTEVVEEVPPDAPTARWFLATVGGRRWRQRSEVEVVGPQELSVDVRDVVDGVLGFFEPHVSAEVLAEARLEVARRLREVSERWRATADA